MLFLEITLCAFFRNFPFSFMCRRYSFQPMVPVKMRLGPIKWLRTINALKIFTLHKKFEIWWIQAALVCQHCPFAHFTQVLYWWENEVSVAFGLKIALSGLTQNFSLQSKFHTSSSPSRYIIDVRTELYLIYRRFLITPPTPKTCLQWRKLQSPRLVHIPLRIQRSSEESGPKF